jgi:hypothetical protein
MSEYNYVLLCSFLTMYILNFEAQWEVYHLPSQSATVYLVFVVLVP